MTMPDLFEQLDSPAENGDDWIAACSRNRTRLLPTPAAGDDGTDTGHEPDLPKRRKGLSRRRPQDRGRWRCDGSRLPARMRSLPASDDTSPSDDLDDMHQDAIPDSAPIWMPMSPPVRSMPAGSY